MNELPTEVVTKIFSYLTIQEILAGPGVACHRFYNIVKSCKELWRKLKTNVEFSVLSFRFIMVHAQNFEVLSLKYSQKSVRYNSPDSYIEDCLSLCVNVRELDLSHNTSVVSLAFTQNMPFLNKIIIKGCTSLDPDIMIAKLGCCKTLTVLDITSCIQLEEHHVFGLIQVCKQLPLLKIFKAEWSRQFSPETVIDILSSSNLSELAVTPSNWGSPLWAEIFKVFSTVRFGECIMSQI